MAWGGKMRLAVKSRELITLLAGAMLFHIRFVVVFCSARLLWAGAMGLMEEHDLDLGSLSPMLAK